jgi:hypothetical protein
MLGREIIAGMHATGDGHTDKPDEQTDGRAPSSVTVATLANLECVDTLERNAHFPLLDGGPESVWSQVNDTDPVWPSAIPRARPRQRCPPSRARQANRTCRNTRSRVLRRCRSAARRKRMVYGKVSTHCR